MLERHLRQAERHVAAGQQHVSRQRELVAQLERHGHDTSRAESLLAQFEGLQMMHIAHRDHLARDLGKAAFAAGAETGDPSRLG
jgi:Spy/CpxP family protein refolding chaperone